MSDKRLTPDGQGGFHLPDGGRLTPDGTGGFHVLPGSGLGDSFAEGLLGLIAPFLIVVALPVFWTWLLLFIAIGWVVTQVVGNEFDVTPVLWGSVGLTALIWIWVWFFRKKN